MLRKIQIISTVFLFVLLASCDTSKPATGASSIYELRIKQAESYVQSGQIKAAQSQLSDILIDHPDSIEAKSILANSYVLTGEADKALRLLADLDSELRDNLYVAEVYLRARLQRGESQSVIRHLESNTGLWASAPKPRDHFKARALSNQGLFAQAKSFLVKRNDPGTNSNIQAELIKLALIEQDLATAEQFLADWQVSDAHNALKLLLEGELHMLAQDLKKAEQSFTEALNSAPPSDPMTLGKAAIYEAISYALIKSNQILEVAVYDRLLNQSFPQREANSRKFTRVLKLIEQQREDEAISILGDMVPETTSPKNASKMACQYFYRQSQISRASEYCQRYKENDQS